MNGTEVKAGPGAVAVRREEAERVLECFRCGRGKLEAGSAVRIHDRCLPCRIREACKVRQVTDAELHMAMMTAYQLLLERDAPCALIPVDVEPVARARARERLRPVPVAVEVRQVPWHGRLEGLRALVEALLLEDGIETGGAVKEAARTELSRIARVSACEDAQALRSRLWSILQVLTCGQGKRVRELARRIEALVAEGPHGEPEGVCPGCGEPAEQDQLSCARCGLQAGEERP